MPRKAHLEAAIMDALWDADHPLLPREVRTQIAPEHKVAYNTVQTVLVRLFEKGRLNRSPDGQAFRYIPTVDRETYAAQRMENLLDTASDKSKLFAAFVDRLSPSERSRLRDELER